MDGTAGIKTGVMVCGHGSRDAEAIREFQAMARALGGRMPQYELESGFLEFARPVIRDGLEALKARGVKRILAVPGMLFAAGHVKNDVPSEINEFARANPGIELRFGRDLAIDPRMLRAAAERVAEAEERAGGRIARADTLLMVVGRGTNDPDANSNVSKVARMLWEGMGFGWAEAAFSGVTAPLVDAALGRAVRLGFRRIVVFPYFLFTGVLVKRIYDWTDRAARTNPDIEFVKVDYLNDHPLVLDTFTDRVNEILAGTGNMNCQMCKYREQIVGFERDRGAAQAGHHHHVRGIGTDADHDHGHDHGHDRHHHGHVHERGK
ncbi:MAG: sirohydrochlorin chelatase [Rhodospirillales bacterium]